MLQICVEQGAVLSSTLQKAAAIAELSISPLAEPCRGSLVTVFPKGRKYRDCKSQNHRMVWVGQDPKDHLVPNPLPWAGALFEREIALYPTYSTSNGCSKPGSTSHTIFFCLAASPASFLSQDNSSKVCPSGSKIQCCLDVLQNERRWGKTDLVQDTEQERVEKGAVKTQDRIIVK